MSDNQNKYEYAKSVVDRFHKRSMEYIEKEGGIPQITPLLLLIIAEDQEKEK